MNTPPDRATVPIPYKARHSSATSAIAWTNASWKRRAITPTGTPAARSSSSALNTGAASSSSTEVSCAVLSGVAVFLTISIR